MEEKRMYDPGLLPPGMGNAPGGMPPGVGNASGGMPPGMENMSGGMPPGGAFAIASGMGSAPGGMPPGVENMSGGSAPGGMPPESGVISPMERYRQEEELRRREEERQRQIGGKLFGKLASASLIYTLIYTFCLYKNMAGITVALWAPALLGYTYYVFRISDIRWKRDSIFVAAVMLLLCLSNVLTGNQWILWLNYAAIFLLAVALLLHNFGNDAEWDFGKYLLEIGTAVCGAVGSMFRPFTDGKAYIKKRKEKNDGSAGAGWYVAAGIGIAVPCLLVLGILLASADLVFADFLERFFSTFLIPEKVFGITFMLLFGFLSSYCGVRFVREHAGKVTVKEHRTGEPVIAITVTAMIALLYLVFCVIQVVYLFLGNMQLPEGVTYAQYARRGFFQLLYVCVLNLILVLAVKKYFRESGLLNVILFVISGCTLVMTASSAYRMLLYIGAYQLTFLRIFVLVALLLIALLMTGVMCLIVKPQFPLFRYGIVAVSVVYLAFSFSHVDYFIASYNLSQVDASGSGNKVVDYAYIYTLSTDAAPAIDAYLRKHPEALRTEKNSGGGADVQDTDSRREQPAESDRNDPYGGVAERTWLDFYLERNDREINDITLRNFNVSHYMAKRLSETWMR